MPQERQNETNGWSQWSRWVLKELERHDKRLTKGEDNQAKLMRMYWLVGGMFAIHTPIYIWLVIRLLEHLGSLLS